MLVIVAALGAACALVLLVLALRSSMAAVADSVQDMFSSTFPGVADDPIGGGGSPAPAKTAFAVYSADDGSLCFYKRAAPPVVGAKFNGKTATEVYTGFEEAIFHITNSPLSDWSDLETDAPWFSHHEEITSVSVIDANIEPLSICLWFARCTNLKSVNLTKMDGSRCFSLFGTFARCSSMSDCALPDDLSRATSVNDAFFYCKSLKELDLSCLGSTPREMRVAFQWCINLETLRLAPQTIFGSADYIFDKCSNLRFDCSEWDVSRADSHFLFSDNAPGVVLPAAWQA